MAARCGATTRVSGLHASMRAGVDRAEYEAGVARFDKMLTIPPEVAADAILAGVHRRRDRVLIGWSARVPDLLARLLPTAHGRLVAAAARRAQPGAS